MIYAKGLDEAKGSSDIFDTHGSPLYSKDWKDEGKESKFSRAQR